MKKKKDITEDLVFRCDVGWCEFFTIAVWDWREDEPIEYSFSIIAEPRGIIARIRKAFQIIFGKQVYMREIILSKEKVDELRRVLNKQ